MNAICRRKSPDIVPVVLRQLAQMRTGGVLNTHAFEEKIQRVCAENLEPNGLSLLVRELRDGNVRFIIKDAATQSVIEMVECG